MVHHSAVALLQSDGEDGLGSIGEDSRGSRRVGFGVAGKELDEIMHLLDSSTKGLKHKWNKKLAVALSRRKVFAILLCHLSQSGTE